ncbi:hypothetical protein PB70LOC_00264 [Pectobacterium versatile]|nr:hypothetical protein PB70LOC_00264 [Pectobacterium versatile]POY64744.1 hypothetical protein PB69LOC_01011 [Pectobacterium versatile]PVY74951.1 hypothetical protein C7330_4274 [Pectobacterium versatile]
MLCVSIVHLPYNNGVISPHLHIYGAPNAMLGLTANQLR